jgi:hypothetical protein
VKKPQKRAQTALQRGGIVELEYLSPEFVKHLDAWAGKIIAANGGYGDIVARMEGGDICWYKWAPQFHPDDWEEETG